MNPLCSSSLHVEKVAAATFSRVSRLLLLAPLPGSKSRKVRKPEGFHPFRRTCRRSRMERQGLRPLTIPVFLTVCMFFLFGQFHSINLIFPLFFGRDVTMIEIIYFL